MKKPFDLSAITAGLPTLPDERETPKENIKPRFPAVPIAKAIETQHHNAIAQLRELEATIERRKADGLIIEEIDTSLTSPSPYWDRDLRFLEDKSFAALVEDMRRNGQQSPALVRPHPTAEGQFEVCFGHRRLFACKTLGTRLLAVVRNLSEAQMAGAIYSENAHRESVSIMEQARALARYVERGVFPTKQALADALNVSRSHVSNLASYADIPDRVLEALGDWRKCTFRDANDLLKATREPSRRAAMLEIAERLISGDPKVGFYARLTLLLGHQRDRGAETDDIRDAAGRVLAVCKRGSRSTTIAFASRESGELADFIWGKLPSLIEEFKSQCGDRK
ncbi:MAG: ParB/RepB/Spo0J family partition protein [Acetobacteraceae bacterium]|nr:ParB/RepB/Spo0J family partition protein [Acetobacteraceae bacterium]